MPTETAVADNTRATTNLRSLAPSYLVLALIVIVFAIVRLRMLHIPLERDEGEYAYAGQLLLQGIPPYKLAFNMKLPGTYITYALIMAAFGQTATAIHVGLLLANIATIVLLFFLTRRVLDSLAATVAAGSYALLSASPSVLGFAGHATHFVVLAALAGLLVTLRATDSERLSFFALGGFFLGLAFLMKQPGIFFVLFALVYLIKEQMGAGVKSHDLFKKLVAFSGAAALPFAFTCLWLWKAGVFSRFWFWTFTYGRLYGTMIGVRDARSILLANGGQVVGSALMIWVLAGVGLIAIWLKRGSPDKFFLPAFLLFSFLAVCPGFYFREHYFILMLPAVAMLAGSAVSIGTEELRGRTTHKSLRFAPVALFLVAFGYTFFQQWRFWFEMDPISASRSVYGANPFPEAVQIADFLRTHTSPSEPIAVVGSEPEIFFYSHRHSATGYIYTYPLMEPQPYALTMQKEMISEIENVRPKFLVFVNVPTSWLRRKDSEPLILAWTQKYVAENYRLDGFVDILGDTQYRWEEAATNYRPVSRYNVQIFKRITS